eukprot:6456214-Amphidinium_carterae.1
MQAVLGCKTSRYDFAGMPLDMWSQSRTLAGAEVAQTLLNSAVDSKRMHKEDIVKVCIMPTRPLMISS